MSDPQYSGPAARLLAAELLTLAANGCTTRGFAVLRRRADPAIELLVGDVVDVGHLADLPLPGAGAPPVLAAVPFRQVRERGFACHDDGAPLRVLRADGRLVLDPDRFADLVGTLPPLSTTLHDARFTVDDADYADLVKQVVQNEIGHGEGANFVIRRDLLGAVRGPDAGRAGQVALRVLSALLHDEPGAYWTFAVQLGDLVAVGASPERHVSVQDGELVMNPVSGTFRFLTGTPDPLLLDGFLRDPKEIEELTMVLDEELKMVSALCTDGGEVRGPLLTGMSRLAHTSYDLVGRCRRDVREVLRETMFAATLTGSPVENACRVIARYEGSGRGYYGATLARIEADAQGAASLDAPILIRTAYLTPAAAPPGDAADGPGTVLQVRIPVGATLVRHSVPDQEVAETLAKVAAVRRAFDDPPSTRRERSAAASTSTSERPPVPAAMVGAVLGDPAVQRLLAQRNADLAPFWLQSQPGPATARPDLQDRQVLVVDAEDAWATMLAHLCRRLGLTTRVQRWDAVRDVDLADADLVVAGPGPGDPRRAGDPRLHRLRGLLTARLAAAAPTLGVCLSHQLAAGLLGLRLGPLPSPHQGTQRRVSVLGGSAPVRVGFYNTFSAWVPPTLVAADGRFDLAAACPSSGRPGAGWAVPGTGEVLALRLPAQRLTTVQFHLESVISPDGAGLLEVLLSDLLAGRH